MLPSRMSVPPTITAHLENVNGSKEPRAVLLWRSGVLPYTKLEEANAQEKVKRLAFDWRRLNFERPSPEYVQQQIRILGWILEMARECLTLAPECYLLAQILASIPARSWKQAGRCGRLFLFTNGQHAML